ncbi:TPR domain protein [Syntrophotalea carbinolica DSM 2380]|uniref:TPR domain protein n=1 Tax=Syntrophotalea carbinolica (strain DSM 2380 / NBRC 103641 / GraBd1) TaxID=338963 RepID=Q3A506_SYNC1|nr:TPR domain protein [Syntrophotalea carbinolica DSM 2380]
MALSKKDKLLQAAQKNIQKGQWLKAAKDYKKVLDLDSKDMRIRQRMAELYNRAGLSAEALEAYEVVAKHYANNGFYLKAIAVYKQMQKIDPSQSRIYGCLAQLNEKQGLVGNALGEYRQLAEIYEKSGNVEELNATLRKMIELDPQNSGLHLRLCQSCLENGISDEANDALQAALVVLEELKKPAATNKMKDLVLAHLPEDMTLKNHIGRILLLCDQPEDTVALLAGEIDRHPADKEMLQVLALAYRQMDDFTSERHLCEQLILQEPDNLDYQESFARSCLDSGDDQAALDCLEGLKENFLAQGRTAVLKEFYEKLQVMRGEDEAVRQALHQIYENTGEGGKLFDLLSDEAPRPVASDVAEDSQIGDSGEWFGDASLEMDEGVVGEDKESADQQEDMVVASGEETFAEKPLLPEQEPLLSVEESEDFVDASVEPVVEAVADDDLEPVPLAEEKDAEIELEFDLDLETSEDFALVEDLPEATLIEDPDGIELQIEDLDPDPDGIELQIEDPDSDEIELQSNSDFAGPDPGGEEDTPQTGAPFHDPFAAGDVGSAPVAEASEASDIEDSFAGMDDGLADLQKELGEVFEMDSFDLDDDDDEPDLTTDLEEAEFYLQQDFLEDAFKKCQSLLERHPNNREVRELLQQVEERMAEQQPAADAPSEEVAAVPEETAPEVPDDGKDRSRLEGNISAFKKGIEDAVAQDDCETHYELGIAYKEMGLFDEAMDEFSKAMGHPSRYVDALTLTGICLSSKGLFDQAAELFKKGLHREALDEGDRLNLYFELGQLYVAWGRPLEALDSFQQVADADLSYRDVGDQICKLREELGLDDGGDSGGSAGGSGSNRVSYL